MYIRSRLCILFTGILLLSSCMAFRITGPEGGMDEPGSGLSKLTVGIERDTSGQDKYALNEFVAALRKANLFKEVGFTDELQNKPDLIVVSYRDDYPMSLDEPYWVVFTLGIVPDINTKEHNVTVSLSPANKQTTVDLRFKYSDERVWGWVALLYKISPKWQSWSDENWSNRYGDVVRAVFNSNSKNLMTLYANQ